MAKSINPGKPGMLNIDDIKGKRTGNFIIHMTGKQWKKAIGDTRIENFDPVRDKNFEGYTAIPLGVDASIDGVVIIPAPCDNICKRTYTQESPLGHCECPPPGGGGGLGFVLCHLVRVNGRFRCGGNCVTGNCRLRIIRGRQGRFEFFRFECVCGV